MLSAHSVHVITILNNFYFLVRCQILGPGLKPQFYAAAFGNLLCLRLLHLAKWVQK